MTRPSAVLISLLLAAPLLAQHSDLRVVLTEAPARLDPGQMFTFGGTAENLGPEPAKNVRVVLADRQPERCVTVIESFPVGEVRAFTCEGQMPVGQIYTMPASISIWSPGQDRAYENNYSYRWILANTPPDLFVFPNEQPVAAPGLPFRLSLEYGNRAQATATNVKITIVAPGPILEVPENCTAEGNRAVCEAGTLEPRDPPDDQYATRMTIAATAPDESARAFAVELSIDATEADAAPQDDQFRAPGRTYRTFFVTSTDDDGGGSLRAAVHSANAECVDRWPCLIAFRIPSTGQAWHTIGLQSALPRVDAWPIRIDGTTQGGYLGDTNAAGPEIEIDGSAVRQGHGLEMGQSGARVLGLAINGFPGNGIVVSSETQCTRDNCVIENNYIGTDPTGTRALPNARGIWLAAPNWLVRSNLVSGNRYAGIVGGRGVAFIEENTIGLDAAGKPLGNGASGVYIGPDASGSDVSSNSIGFNGHFGIAIAAAARNVSAPNNSLQANFHHGIDWGLDGAVTTTPVPIPEITAVRVEDGKTIIEATSTALGTFWPTMHFFANDAPDPSGYGEAQYVLGDAVHPQPSPSAVPRYRFVVPRDLRGKWITATVTHHFYNGWIIANGETSFGYMTTTSELSRAVEVK